MAKTGGLRKEFHTKKTVTPARIVGKVVVEPEKVKYHTEMWLVPKGVKHA